MELLENITLNEVEYTLTLNRESAIHIERYAKVQESLLEVSKPTVEYVDREILKGENPFEKPIDEDKLLEEVNEKEELLVKTIAKSFWIWLYPKHKLDYEEVYSIIKGYMQSVENAEFIGTKYSEYLDKSISVRNDFIEEQKKAKAQATKKN